MSDPAAPAPQPGSAPVSPQAPAPDPGSHGWFARAASTTGGQVALVLGAVFTTLLLVTGVGLATAAVVGGVLYAHGDDGRMPVSDRGPGQGKGLALGHDKQRGMGRGDDQGQGRGEAEGAPGRGNGNGKGGPGAGQGQGNGRGARGMGKGMGMGRQGLGAPDVLHGEFTTNVTGTPTVMVVQSGQVTAYTAGKSLTVRSSDGFEATYALDEAVASMRGAADLAAGAQVQVIAAKEGMKVTRLSVE